MNLDDRSGCDVLSPSSLKTTCTPAPVQPASHAGRTLISPYTHACASLYGSAKKAPSVGHVLTLLDAVHSSASPTFETTCRDRCETGVRHHTHRLGMRIETGVRQVARGAHLVDRMEAQGGDCAPETTCRDACRAAARRAAVKIVGACAIQRAIVVCSAVVSVVAVAVRDEGRVVVGARVGLVGAGAEVA